MYKIIIEIPFRAGHRLVAPYKGKCNNPHGEGYTAIIEFSSKVLDENGMLLDFGKTKKRIKEWIDENWDHAYIGKNTNEDEILWKIKNMNFKYFEMNSNPTAENMSSHLFREIEKMKLPVSKVLIVESFRDSIASYEI
jgi:6-pyruvoyltetrahydropterin/6-carboxytetrahydropterin synthase